MYRFLPRLLPHRILARLMVPFRTMRESDLVPPRWRRKSTKSTYSYPSSHKASRRLLRQWLPRRKKLLVLNKLLGILWLVSPLWKQMQPVDLRALTLRGPGLHSNEVDVSTATGSFGSHRPGSSDDNRHTRRRLDTSKSPDYDSITIPVYKLLSASKSTKRRCITIPMRTISHWSCGVVQQRFGKFRHRTT